MRKRLKLSERHLPNYTRGEEIMNMVTHIAGGGLGILALLAGIFFSVLRADVYRTVSAIIYGAGMICLYAMSSIYHGLRPGMGKKVLQVLAELGIILLNRLQITCSSLVQRLFRMQKIS